MAQVSKRHGRRSPLWRHAGRDHSTPPIAS